MPSKAKLSFEFIANACGIFTGKNATKILCDPWLVDGVFEGSWCHFPKLKTDFDYFKDVDAIYISHLHPDHFDERYFDFDKSLTLIVMDHGPNFLIRKLESLGYQNLVKIKNKETVRWREFELTMFAPFATNNFYESEVGNLIDSAFLVSCDGVTALNANDNTLTLEAAEMFLRDYGPITLAMMNYNAAGPYPCCFDNLTEEEKLSEHYRILERNFAHIKECLEVMKPKFLLPFAGAYVLGGSLHYKNKYLGTTTWDECAAWLAANYQGNTKTVLLRENDVLDVETGLSDNEYIPIDVSEMERYIAEDLSKLLYPYQQEDMPDIELLLTDMQDASERMLERMNRYGVKSDFSVLLEIENDLYSIYPSFIKVNDPSSIEKAMTCHMDLRLLRYMLDRKAHWNNAEIGAHISMTRSPNAYEPDLHTGLQFFHL